MNDWTELKRFAEEATKGDWYVEGSEDCYCIASAANLAVYSTLSMRDWSSPHDDLSFIAAANPKTILALIAENERLREGIKGDYDLDAWLDWAIERDQLRAEVEALRKDAELLDKLEKTAKIGSRSVPPHDDDSWQGIYAFRTQLQGRSIRDALWSAIENEPAYMDYVRELNRK